MPIARVEINEYECALCGYKWVNRVNGKDGSIPKRCAKCKHQHWEKGPINSLEQSWRHALKKRFGYWFDFPPNMGGWRIDDNATKYLETRPSIEEMKVLLKPMSYLYTYKPNSSKSKYKPSVGCVPDFPHLHEKKIDWEATEKAHEYQKQLSRELLKDLMTQRGIPYDEKEAKMQTLYSRHGKYAIPMLRLIPELCNALRNDWYPDVTDEQIRSDKQALENIKAKILKDQSKELQYVVASPEEIIQSCWPDWLIAKPSN
jgi:hypothetical protein